MTPTDIGIICPLIKRWAFTSHSKLTIVEFIEELIMESHIVVIFFLVFSWTLHPPNTKTQFTWFFTHNPCLTRLIAFSSDVGEANLEHVTFISKNFNPICWSKPLVKRTMRQPDNRSNESNRTIRNTNGSYNDYELV